MILRGIYSTMAELLGIVSAAVGVMGFTIQVLGIVVQFGSHLKQAPEDVKGFVEEVKVLHKTLSAISSLAIDHDFVEAFGAQDSFLRTTSETSLLLGNCCEQLDKFLKKFNAAGRQKNALERGFDIFKNALRATDLKDTVVKLDRCCRQLNEMIILDTGRLVSKLVVETRKTDAKQERWHEEGETRETLQWLSSLDFRSKQEDVLAKCCSGTGQWILNHEDFIKWRDGGKGNHSSSRFFFLCWKFRASYLQKS